jgi:hypothetical protein
VILQPSCCSSCSVAFDGGDVTMHVLACGCACCGTCVSRNKLRNLVTCPTCDVEHEISTRAFNGHYHTSVTGADLEAQQSRIQVIRKEIRGLEQQMESISDSEVVSTDDAYVFATPVGLSDSSPEVTSSASEDSNEYRNTEYCVLAARLRKMIALRERTQNRLARNAVAAQTRAAARAKFSDTFGNVFLDDPKGREAARLRAARLAHLQSVRKTQRLQRQYERRMRMLAHQGATLDVKKAAKKVTKKNVSDDEEEPAAEDDEENKKKEPEPNDIEAVLKKLASNPFRSLNYIQRCKLKQHGWNRIVKTFERRTAELKQRLEKAGGEVERLVEVQQQAPNLVTDRELEINRSKVAVLTARLQKAEAQNAATWNKINDRIRNINDKLKVDASRTRVSRKLAVTELLRVALLTDFYPEQLPPPPAKSTGESDEE